VFLATMRSKLFVPGSRPELFAKAMTSDADGLSFDLEDAVAPERKAEARAAVAAFLRDLPPGHGKAMIVRVNARGTPHFEADVAAVAQPALDALNLPMCEAPEDVVAAAALLERAGCGAGILVNIETPRALRRAAELALAHPRVCGLQIGYADLFEPAGIARDEEAALAHVRVAVRVAAAEAGVPAFDGALAAIASPERLAAESRAAKRLGFAGKSCIHPSQIDAVNAAFLPGEAELAHARRVLAAAREAQASGIGAFTVDGQMVDAPFIARARAVLARVGEAAP
jgi:citrate lyase subunit beta/citryl-CoA lyase